MNSGHSALIVLGLAEHTYSWQEVTGDDSDNDSRRHAWAAGRQPGHVPESSFDQKAGPRLRPPRPLVR